MSRPIRVIRSESHYYAAGRAPSLFVELVHRWWYRRWYSLLPEFYQDFYPFENALLLTMQWVRHKSKWAAEDSAEHDTLIRRAVELERDLCTLRLALAAAQLGWNEDRVDRFMETWFPRHPQKKDAGAVG